MLHLNNPISRLQRFSKFRLTLTWGVAPGYYIFAPLALRGFRFDTASEAQAIFVQSLPGRKTLFETKPIANFLRSTYTTLRFDPGNLPRPQA
jgi:hypothetical protein